MTGTKSNLSAESILALHEETAAIPVLLTGVLDAKIAETKALIADLDKRQGIVKTLEEAEKIKADAQAEAMSVTDQARTELAAKLQNADALLAQATQKMADADAREKETSTGLAKLVVDRGQFVAEQAAFEQRLAASQSRIDAKAVELTNREADLNNREAKLKADQAAFNKKLEALKA